MGWMNIQLEGDALEIIQAFKRDENWRGSYGVLVQDATQQLDKLLEWRMDHVPRQANKDAHTLPKFALPLHSEQLWLTDFPICILLHVLACCHASFSLINELCLFQKNE